MVPSRKSPLRNNCGKTVRCKIHAVIRNNVASSVEGGFFSSKPLWRHRAIMWLVTKFGSDFDGWTQLPGATGGLWPAFSSLTALTRALTSRGLLFRPLVSSLPHAASVYNRRRRPRLHATLCLRTAATRWCGNFSRLETVRHFALPADGRTPPPNALGFLWATVTVSFALFPVINLWTSVQCLGPNLVQYLLFFVFL